MAYTKFEYDKTKWQNKSDGTSTPIGKKNLNHIEEGIYGTAEALDEAYIELKGDLDTLNQGGLNIKEDFIGQQVNEWLDEHPEATTTVQDESITIRKLSKSAIKDIKKGMKVIFMPISAYKNTDASGDCTVFVTPNEHKTIMIDSGASHSYSLIKNTLNENGISHIDVFVLTHYHVDHYGNIVSLKNDCFIDANTVSYLPKTKNEEIIISNWGNESEVLNNLEGEKYFPDESIINLDEVEISFFNCNEADYDYYDTTKSNNGKPDCNNYSMCCYVNYKNTTILMAGDIQYHAQEYLVNKGYIKKCDILKVPHHGWETTAYDDFVLECSPEYAVVSACAYHIDVLQGKYGRFANYLRGIGCKTYCTGYGAIYCGSNDGYSVYGNGVEVHTRNDTNYKIHVDSSYSGESTGSAIHPFTKLNKALAFASVMNVNNVEIVFDDNYVEAENVIIANARPKITINVFNTSGRILSYYSNIILNDIVSTNTDNNAISITGGSCDLNRVQIVGEVKDGASPANGKGISFYNCLATLIDCVISNKSIALGAYKGSNLALINIGGVNNDYLLWSGVSSKVSIQSKTIEYGNVFTSITDSKDGIVDGAIKQSPTDTVKVIYHNDNSSSTNITTNIDLSKYKRKNLILFASNGGLYLISAWNNSVNLYTIQESKQIASINVSNKTLNITYTGVIDLVVMDG